MKKKRYPCDDMHTLAFRISAEDKEAVEKEAKRIGVTMSTYARMALKEKINKRGEY